MSPAPSLCPWLCWVSKGGAHPGFGNALCVIITALCNSWRGAAYRNSTLFLFPHVSGSEQGSDRPVKGGDTTLPLPRVPVQSGANWFGKKNFTNPKGYKVFSETAAFILTQPLSFCFLGGQFCQLLHRSFSCCQRKLGIHASSLKNPKPTPAPPPKTPKPLSLTRMVETALLTLFVSDYRKFSHPS